jgi:regulator of protease activity HflC (stomatin/prohibitin superfamily)
MVMLEAQRQSNGCKARAIKMTPDADAKTPATGSFAGCIFLKIARVFLEPKAGREEMLMAEVPIPPALGKAASVAARIFVVAAIAAVVLPMLFGGAFGLFRNPVTPPGYVGYVTRGALIGQTQFYGLQTGPTSTGLGWLLDVVNVSVTPFTYSEDFVDESSVLSADSLKIAFRVHVVWRVIPEKVKDFVERYSTIRPGDSPDHIVEVAYGNFIREPLRTYARDEVQKYKGLDVKDNISPVGEAITRRIRAIAENTPFEIRSVVVGNIQYPQEVADAVSRKLAAVQELERKATEIEITTREKEKRVIEAEGIAKATEIISQRLTAAYLQYEAIKAQNAMINSNNHTTIYIPVGPMGVPLVGNLNLGQVAGGKPAQEAGPQLKKDAR